MTEIKRQGDGRSAELFGLFREAIRVWGSAKGVRTWMQTPLPVLNDRQPADFLGTTEGRRQIQEIVRKVETGDFS